MSTFSKNIRREAIRLISQVAGGQSLQQLMPKALEQLPEKERGLFQEMIYGTLRQWYKLIAVIRNLTNNKKLDTQVQAALALGLYQLFFMRIAEHAVINETVNALKSLKLASAAGLVNAILRRSLREKDAVQRLIESTSRLPKWLQEKIAQQWPKQFEQLKSDLGQIAPVFLRINLKQITASDYLAKLTATNIAAEIIDSHSIRLLQSVSIPQLPGYQEGFFSVQDLHAQLLSKILPSNLSELEVVDACAAPGGKTALMLEQGPPAQVDTFDLEPSRLHRVRENLERLQLLSDAVHIFDADATQYQRTHPADIVVIDAPCTATGVIRRHPDILLLRKESDVESTVALQKQILDQQWKNVKNNGKLIYITCSILQEENEQQIKDFIDRHKDASVIDIAAFDTLSKAFKRPVGYQFFPTTNEGDGFYYALIEKKEPLA